MDALLKLNKFQQRQAAAILGAIVADAAAGPLHWVYKRPLMEKVLKSTNDWAFYKDNVNEFYILEVGQSTVYGDICLSMTQSIAEKQTFDVDHWKKLMYNAFGDDNSPYQKALEIRKKYKEEKKADKIPGPWIIHDLIHFVEQYKKEGKLGIESNDTDAYAATVALTAFYAGQTAKKFLKDQENKNDDEKQNNNNNDGINFNEKNVPEYPEKNICDAMKVLITKEETLNRSIVLSKLLWFSIMTGEDDTLKSLKYIQSQINNDDSLVKEIDDVLKYADEKDHSKVASNNNEGFGVGCPMPGSFKTSLHTIITYGQKGNYKEAILQEIAAGGDNGGRGIITGSIIGSIATIKNIPEDYCDKTLAIKNATKWIIDLIEASWK